jgi:hypothetical protein
VLAGCLRWLGACDGWVLSRARRARPSPPGSCFSPPLAAQRHAFVAGALLAADAATVLDLGCGEARLIEYLLAGAADRVRI